jgi:hypothetical protein
MKRILPFLLIIPGLCYSQDLVTHKDSLYVFYRSHGDSVYKDTAAAGTWYRKALELFPWQNEIAFRLKHMAEFKYAPDIHFNNFFYDHEWGRASGKDHSYNYQAELYRMALHEAKRSSCRLLRSSWYYVSMRDHLRWRKWHRHL